ncbi:MAG TPA: DUF2231 domain-containing protein [Gemmatimonadaceae bacterium]|nr:DUF2231 domain-containing protein [Gemmatimonadaceae bacterium]
MPNLAAFHPQIVHFVIGLLLVGVAMRIVSLTGKLRFTSAAATTLLLIGTVAAWFAVRSGDQAHGPVERIPGARPAVIEHEEYAEKTLNFFYAVAALELIALAMLRKETVSRHARWVYGASAIVGMVGAFYLYETGEHGGELVYSYGGGPGLRTGDPEDTERLLVAGLYNQAMADRKAGRSADAAELIATMARRNPANVEAQLLNAESMSLDAKRYPEAMQALNLVQVPADDARLGARKATIRADIFIAMGQRDSARSTLTAAVAAYPANTRLKAKLDSLK